MGVVVSLKKVAEELDILSDQMTAYLNLETGETYIIQEDDLFVLDEDEENLHDWSREMKAQIQEIHESDAWLELPDSFDIHHWSIMDDFARSLEDDDLSDELMNAIRGRGAFRYFKDTVYRRGIQDRWYAFKQARLEEIAAEWLDEHGIAYTRGDGVDSHS